MKIAQFQMRQEDDKVLCGLCAHHCVIAPGRRGICAVRENRGGVLYSLVFDKVIARNIDPVEKKPLFHFLPGSRSYSVATAGCNFRCKHCQNADISQLPRDSHGDIQGLPISPAQIVDSAREAQCSSISYTYTEPTIYFELAYETAQLAAAVGLKNIFVTNGYITRDALKHIQPYLHAANIDLKAYTDDFYRNVCGARLQPVLDAIRYYNDLGIWIEITTLVIPGYNDSEQELRSIAEFIKSVDQNIPWHVSRFHPTYLLTEQPRTPIHTLHRAREIGLESGLRFVYEGNVPGEGEETVCWNCHRSVVRRYGFTVEEMNIRDGACAFCGTVIAGRWS